MGKAVARGSRKQVISECMKDHRMKMYTIQLIGQTLRREMAALCSEHANSMLRDQTASALTGFTWGKLYDELTVQAPTMLALLESCTLTRKPRLNRTAIVGMCAALLLKFRFHKMCLVQKIISLIMYPGHSGKQVNTCTFRYIPQQHNYTVFIIIIGISEVTKSECVPLTPSNYDIGKHPWH